MKEVLRVLQNRLSKWFLELMLIAGTIVLIVGYLYLTAS